MRIYINYGVGSNTKRKIRMHSANSEEDGDATAGVQEENKGENLSHGKVLGRRKRLTDTQ